MNMNNQEKIYYPKNYGYFDLLKDYINLKRICQSYNLSNYILITNNILDIFKLAATDMKIHETEFLALIIFRFIIEHPKAYSFLFRKYITRILTFILYNIHNITISRGFLLESVDKLVSSIYKNDCKDYIYNSQLEMLAILLKIFREKFFVSVPNNFLLHILVRIVFLRIYNAYDHFDGTIHKRLISMIFSFGINPNEYIWSFSVLANNDYRRFLDEEFELEYIDIKDKKIIRNLENFKDFFTFFFQFFDQKEKSILREELIIILNVVETKKGLKNASNILKIISLTPPTLENISLNLLRNIVGWDLCNCTLENLLQLGIPCHIIRNIDSLHSINFFPVKNYYE